LAALQCTPAAVGVCPVAADRCGFGAPDIAGDWADADGRAGFGPGVCAPVGRRGVNPEAKPPAAWAAVLPRDLAAAKKSNSASSWPFVAPARETWS
jgi:hypothetical protein